MTDFYNSGFILLYICAIILQFIFLIHWCVRRKRRSHFKSEILNNETPVVVTSATHTAPGDNSVTQMPPPGGYQTNVTVTSYPTHQYMQPHMASYPPMAAQSSAMNPPSYDVAVADARYPKQAPYNPSFTAQ